MVFADPAIEKLYLDFETRIIPLVIHNLHEGTWTLNEKRSYPLNVVYDGLIEIENNETDELIDILDIIGELEYPLMMKILNRASAEIDKLMADLPGPGSIQIEGIDWNIGHILIIRATIWIEMSESYVLIGFYAGALDSEEYYTDDVEADKAFYQEVEESKKQSAIDNEEWEIYLELEYSIPDWEWINNERLNEWMAEGEREVIHHQRKETD